jgi:hypothetical protein
VLLTISRPSAPAWRSCAASARGPRGSRRRPPQTRSGFASAGLVRGLDRRGAVEGLGRVGGLRERRDGALKPRRFLIQIHAVPLARHFPGPTGKSITIVDHHQAGYKHSEGSNKFSAARVDSCGRPLSPYGMCAANQRFAKPARGIPRVRGLWSRQPAEPHIYEHATPFCQGPLWRSTTTSSCSTSATPRSASSHQIRPGDRMGVERGRHDADSPCTRA